MPQTTEQLKETISAIFLQEMGDRPLAMDPLLGGVVNIVYSVRLPAGNFVIRMNPGSLAVYSKEKWAMEQAAAVGAAVPEVFAIGEHDGLSYMIMEKIEGISGSEYKGDAAPLVQELGRIAQLVNKVEVEGYGFHLDFSPAPRFTEKWRDMVSWEKDFIFGKDTLIRMGALDKNQFRHAQMFLDPMQDWEYPARLSHSDISLGNMILGNDGVVYLIDWTQAKGSPAPYFDIGNFTTYAKNPAHVKAFLKGYGLDDQQYLAVKPDADRVGIASVLRAAVWAAGENHPELPKFIADVQRIYKNILPAQKSDLRFSI